LVQVVRLAPRHLYRTEGRRDLMTIGPENLGNGAAKTEERNASPLGYRPRANRDGGSLPAGPLNGSALNGTPLGSGPLGSGPLNGTTLDIANPIASALTQPKLDESDLREPLGRESLGRESLGREPLGDVGYRDGVFHTPQREGGGAPSSGWLHTPVDLPVDSWLDGSAPAVVDHPLLRGLLLELPPKGATLQAQWLDRWFEAARSILELLYRFEDKRD
jgi:hypothetical protein